MPGIIVLGLKCPRTRVHNTGMLFLWGEGMISKVESIVRSVQKDRRSLPRPALYLQGHPRVGSLWSFAQSLESRVTEWKDPNVNGDVYFYGSFMNINKVCIKQFIQFIVFNK